MPVMATAAGPADRAPAFVFVGGSPALDLVATFGRRHAGGVERIPDPDALARWFVAAGVLPSPPPVAGSELGLARRLREAIAVLVRSTIAGQPADDAAVRLVNACAGRRDLPPRLVVDPDGRLAERSGDGAAGAALAGIARDAVRLLGGRRPGGSRSARIRTARWCSWTRPSRPGAAGAPWSAAETWSRSPVTGLAAPGSTERGAAGRRAVAAGAAAARIVGLCRSPLVDYCG